jgi:cell division protein ZapD
VITYEYPLNERIRTLLRLEDLFERSRHFIGLGDPHDHHMALLTLFEILEVSSRADLKSDLLQELERQKQVLLSFKNNPDISEDALSGVIRDIEQAAAALFAMTGKIGQYLRENDWLMSIKQRTGIPGGACEFDLPSYHYWLHRPAEERTGQLAAWTGPLYPLRDGTAIILRILRESGKAQPVKAPQGTFQQMGGKTAQMLRVRLAKEQPCVPEISANKYVLNIRFLAQNGAPGAAAGAPSGSGGAPAGSDARTRTADWDVDFELTFCNL